MIKSAKKILIIQTASIGDVILATPVIEAMKKTYPDAHIDFLMKKGFQDLFFDHPHLHAILFWDKRENKNQNLWDLIKYIRKQNYDVVINLQRFFSTGLITALSGAKVKAGFTKNPLSIFFTHKTRHQIGNTEGTPHETERNLSVIAPFATSAGRKPVLYPNKGAFAKVSQYKTRQYVCIAPASLWQTKQYPKEKWIDFINDIPQEIQINLVGSKADKVVSKHITDHTHHPRVLDLCGSLSLLESAALIKDASMNYVNDSAVLHMASAMNAPVTAIFCSTVPAFGFGPLSDDQEVIEHRGQLSCRPCGLHGKKECPEGHFRCALDIDKMELIGRLP